MVQTESVDVVKPDIDARDFFSKYVSKRQPVIIDGLLNDPSFQARKWADLDYLSAQAGDVELLVEPIHQDKRQYGTDAPRIPSTFGDFVASLKHPSQNYHYLTTQYAQDEEEEDLVTAFPPPTKALLDDVPVNPRLMGNLVLQQVNLWLGKSKEGSSSGLHHDFHDNLYCLLRGRKRFVLFPPQEVKHLSPHGTLHKIYENGLICYKDAIVRSDGLPPRLVAKARVKVIERQMDALHNDSGKGKKRADDEALAALQAAHDEAVEELLRVTMDDHSELQSNEAADDFDLLGDEFKDEDGLDMEGDFEGGDDESEDNEESLVFEDDTEDSGSDTEEISKEPSSFSRIPPAYLHKHLDLNTTARLPPNFSHDFLELSKAVPPYVIELHEGQMLYLPASWWHEVTSSSPPAEDDDAKNVHMAFNYWFYPPDALDCFEEPYADQSTWGYLRDEAASIAERAIETLSDRRKRKRDSEEGLSAKRVRT